MSIIFGQQTADFTVLIEKQSIDCIKPNQNKNNHKKIAKY